MPGGEPEFGHWRFWRRWFGRRSERYAAKFLRREGYRILAINQADRRGELDLLVFAPDRTTLVVVEVRSTSHPDPRRAADSVDARKQKRIADATLRFLGRRRLLGTQVRFDVLAISWPPGREPTFLHLIAAFDSPGRFQMFS